MTATHLADLIAAADLSLRGDRLMLADALDDAGREEEAALCRDLSRACASVLEGDCHVAPCLRREIPDACIAYCERHAVEEDGMMVEEMMDHSGRCVVGFRLSLDVDGRSHGCDETFGEWR